MSVGKRKEIENKNEVIFNYLNEMPEGINIDVEKEKRVFFEKIEKRRVKSYCFILFKYAAIAILLISTSYFLTKNQFASKKDIVIDNNIKIGIDKAVLTLGDGEKVELEKGKTFSGEKVNSDGEKLVYNKKEADTTKNLPTLVYNYLTIPRGGEFYIELADDTKVWLNSESKIKYPVEFRKGEPREVELLYGEAYFVVSDSKNHNGDKFRVLTQGQEVEVFGTEFNIKAYPEEEEIKTTLVEGSIALVIDNINKFLNPSQQSIYNKTDETVLLKSVNTFYETSWRLNEFNFNGKSLEEVMAVLSRWYDVEIEIQLKNKEDFKYIGTIGKNQNIEIILLTLKNTNNLNYEIAENKITIK